MNQAVKAQDQCQPGLPPRIPRKSNKKKIKYSVKCAVFRMMWWMNSNCGTVREGISKCRMGQIITAVCCEEKESVDAVKMIMPHTTAGHQARSQAGINDFAATRTRSSSSSGAGRGLRQGSEPDK